MASILESSRLVVSPVHQLVDFALKSPMAIIKKELVAKTTSRVSSKLLENSSSDWSGDLYKEKKLQILSPSYTFLKVINID